MMIRRLLGLFLFIICVVVTKILQDISFAVFAIPFSVVLMFANDEWIESVY